MPHGQRLLPAPRRRPARAERRAEPASSTGWAGATARRWSCTAARPGLPGRRWCARAGVARRCRSTSTSWCPPTGTRWAPGSSRGLDLWLGRPADRPGAERRRRWPAARWRRCGELGLEPGLLSSHLVLTPACGLAGADRAGRARRRCGPSARRPASSPTSWPTEPGPSAAAGCGMMWPCRPSSSASSPPSCSPSPSARRGWARATSTAARGLLVAHLTNAFAVRGAEPCWPRCSG